MFLIRLSKIEIQVFYTIWASLKVKLKSFGLF